MEHGWGPVAGFFIGENIDRFTTRWCQADRNVLFYMPVLFGDLFPWAPLLILPLVSAWRRRTPAEEPRHVAIRRLLWVWIVVIAGAFSLSETKQDLYIFPMVPAVAVLVADTIVSSAFGLARLAVRRMIGVAALLTIAGGVGAAWLFSSGYYQLTTVLPAVGVLIAGGLVAVAALAVSRAPRAVMALGAAFVIFNYLFVLRVLPELERWKPAVPLAAVINQRVPATAELGDYKGALPPSLVFYVGRPVQRMGEIDHAVAFFMSSRGSWALVEDVNDDELRQRVPGLCEVARRPVFEAKVRDLVAGRPPSSIILVTNQCEAATR